MKVFKKLSLLFLLSLFALIAIPICSHAANTPAGDESSLVDAIKNASNNDTISLSTNIVIKAPIDIAGKNLTINGNGHTISANTDEWQASGENSTLITAGKGTKLTLKNLTLSNSVKYGVQAYNGGHVVLDNVEIKDCAYGGVLANAGTVEVVNLHLGHNGREGTNNGIEIARGTSLADGDTDPVLIMNGSLSSTEKNNVVYIDTNDPVGGFEIINTENSTNKVFINDNKLVVADKNNTIIYQGNDIGDVAVEGEEYKETVPEKVPEKPKKDGTPKTGSSNLLEISAIAIAISSMAILVLKRKDLSC